MTKYILLAVIILALVALVGCVSGTVAVGEYKTYDVKSDITSLDIEINAADFTIVHGDKFSVESNLVNLMVSDDNGVLKVVENTRHAVSYSNAVLKVSIPANVVFDNVSIKTGAAKLNAQSISADNVKLRLGAGKVQFDSIVANERINIKGGAGNISINDGTLNNLTLDLGVGALDMTAQLCGESVLKFGVGESDLTLKGNKDDYSFDVHNGVGRTNIEGISTANLVSNGNGDSHIKIKGGVGETNITFQE
ncbi:MAG: DUF4097 family beta strand repeat protein [Ruminococcus sp.]|nr:DUF4097 family beta strand repeat protein [Ruminococcus sp.]